jgi:hypothetical protein
MGLGTVPVIMVAVLDSPSGVWLSWLWLLAWLGLAHLATLLVGLGTPDAWTLDGALRAGLMLCACEVSQAMLFGAYGCGASSLGWAWVGLGAGLGAGECASSVGAGVGHMGSIGAGLVAGSVGVGGGLGQFGGLGVESACGTAWVSAEWAHGAILAYGQLGGSCCGGDVWAQGGTIGTPGVCGLGMLGAAHLPLRALGDFGALGVVHAALGTELASSGVAGSCGLGAPALLVSCRFGGLGAEFGSRGPLCWMVASCAGFDGCASGDLAARALAGVSGLGIGHLAGDLGASSQGVGAGFVSCSWAPCAEFACLGTGNSSLGAGTPYWGQHSWDAVGHACLPVASCLSVGQLGAGGSASVAAGDYARSLGALACSSSASCSGFGARVLGAAWGSADVADASCAGSLSSGHLAVVSSSCALGLGSGHGVRESGALGGLAGLHALAVSLPSGLGAADLAGSCSSCLRALGASAGLAASDFAGDFAGLGIVGIESAGSASSGASWLALGSCVAS